LESARKESPLNENTKKSSIAEEGPKTKYEAPRIKVLTEEEVLSAFQVTAAGTTMWWA
jgi:hypothetical protein